jgi:glucose-1-phosphate thymidylyltransferase
MINVGLILAAGKGKRMGYLSEVLPKPLFPLYDKPIIHHIVENMQHIGVNRIHVVVNHQKERVIEYLTKVGQTLQIEFSFIYQEDLLGIAHAISLTEEFIHEPFLAILGDDCTITNSLSNLVDVFFEKDAVAVEGVVEENDFGVLKRTCCLNLDADGRILEIVEKPQIAVSSLRGVGVYIFDERIFDYIRKTPVTTIRNEKEITHTIGLVAKDRRAFGEFINGVNININTLADLFEAWNLARRVYVPESPLLINALSA